MTSDPTAPNLRDPSDHVDAPLSPATAGPGQAIRQARERAKLGIEELATLTRLARGTLEALERNDFSTLTEAVYVRGYYRKCAKVLNLSEAELIAAYDKLYAPKSAPLPTKMLLGNSGSTMGSSRPSSGSGSGWIIVLVIAALVAAGVWFVNQDAADGVAAPTPAGEANPAAGPAIPAGALTTPEAAPAPAEVAPAASAAAPAAGGDAAKSAAPAPVPAPSAALSPTGPGLALMAATTLSSLPASADPAASTATTSVDPTATVSSAGGALLLDFKSSSWVRIEDADGRTLLSGTIPSGDRQLLRGRPPYALFIGYAPGVRVEFDGKPFDLTPHLRQNSTVRINLPYVPAAQ